MTLESESDQTAATNENQFLEPALAYRLIGEMVRRLESFQEHGRLELALLQIESIGALLAQLTRDQGPAPEPSPPWKVRTTYSLIP